ncbi:hypothetical protein ACFQZT_30725 [Paenibacillus sp. GCM10027628]|uniref:hypothetical protein n=1 Tax=Paenibacillus sp. GCM10027628 TaxID=3273413 RepID=UPI003629D8DD
MNVASAGLKRILDTKMVRESGISPLGSVRSGAYAVVYLAVSSELVGVSGKYFDRKRNRLPTSKHMTANFVEGCGSSTRA